MLTLALYMWEYMKILKDYQVNFQLSSSHTSTSNVKKLLIYFKQLMLMIFLPHYW